MPNMRRKQEHLAGADWNISDNTLFDHFQHHVPAQLIEELVSRIVVEIDPLVGSAYDLDNHTALIKERLVADRRLEQIPIHVYPALEIKRTLHRYLPGSASPMLAARSGLQPLHARGRAPYSCWLMKRGDPEPPFRQRYLF